ACSNACEMWKAIKRLKQGEYINVQDLETNLYWEFGKFTSQDAWECQKPKRAKDVAYHREKMLLCKQEEAGIQLNAEQANWRDDTDDDELEDQELEAHYMYMAQVQEQHQHEVNEIRAEKIARVANLLALVAQQQQVYHPYNHPTLISQHSSTRTHQSATRKREKAVVTSPQPMNVGYEGQRSGTVVGARDTIGLSMVQKSRIQCYNCKEYEHVARDCQKPKRAKDAAYHREKMLLCK
nr:hypothetical protein [Tanacetum cinerariifolium]